MMLYSAGAIQNIPVDGQRLCGVTWMGQVLWYSDAALEQILAVDPQSGQIVRKIACEGVRTGLTTLAGNLVQVVGPQWSLRFLDPDSGRVVDELPNPRPGNELCGLEATRGGLWLGYRDLRTLDLRSPDDMELRQAIEVNDDIAGVTVTDRFVAAASFAKSAINLIDPRREEIAISIDVHGKPTGITWDGRRLWYCDYATVQLRSIEVPGIVAEE